MTRKERKLIHAALGAVWTMATSALGIAAAGTPTPLWHKLAILTLAAVSGFALWRLLGEAAKEPTDG